MKLERADLGACRALHEQVPRENTFMLHISLLGSPPKSKCIGFLLTKLWVKGFEGMGYGLLGIWIMGESTVVREKTALEKVRLQHTGYWHDGIEYAKLPQYFPNNLTLHIYSAFAAKIG